MGIKGQDAISCRGGLGLHKTRGERRIQEMERHLKCMRDKLCILETMLPRSLTNRKIQEGEPETDGQEDNCEGGCSNLNGGKEDEEQTCFLKSLAIKENKLREEIFHMECKEKTYLKALSKVKVNQCDKEEIKKPEDDNLPDLSRSDDHSPRSRKGESGVKEKISQLEEYSKKLCQCLRSIQNNRMEWYEEAEYLSKELNVFEDDRGLEEFWGFYKPERNKEKGDDCPCGEPAKCNSCTICTCSEWEEDLKIGLKENPKEVKEPKFIDEQTAKKKSNCDCNCNSSDSKSSKSFEINDIYNCSFSKMQSEMSIATASIPSTDDLMIGDANDKKNFCCLCNPEDDCQKFCEICLCEWEQKHRENHKLYLDEYDECETCNEERCRGGTDLGILSQELFNNGFRESLLSVINKFTSAPENKIKEGHDNLNKEMPSSVGSSQIYENIEIEQLKLNLQLLKVRNNALRKWIQDRSHQINVDPSKEKIIAVLLDELKNFGSDHPKIPTHSRRGKPSYEKMPRKDLAIGLFVLIAACWDRRINL
ncbi:uncharacterized protein LOC117176712 [Belonocnema kinseyi]|uniref:uncharacterized protein LOC117176712 n=1 Tax=Belonocnema kinseyi TaxID=2817044 RepID=UPI00143D0726|nr:uncharacterized protein LOC117176712 [Belonocnema kinseyi]